MSTTTPQLTLTLPDIVKLALGSTDSQPVPPHIGIAIKTLDPLELYAHVELWTNVDEEGDERVVKCICWNVLAWRTREEQERKRKKEASIQRRYHCLMKEWAELLARDIYPSVMNSLGWTGACLIAYDMLKTNKLGDLTNIKKCWPNALKKMPDNLLVEAKRLDDLIEQQERITTSV